jgi:hypothetical protein
VDDRDYQVPFAFTGKSVKLGVKFARMALAGGHYEARGGAAEQ